MINVHNILMVTIYVTNNINTFVTTGIYQKKKNCLLFEKKVVVIDAFLRSN